MSIQSGHQKFSNIDFWREFSPRLNITNDQSFSEIPVFNIGLDNKVEISRRMLREGYFQGNVPWKIVCDDLAKTIRALAEQDLPTVFGFIYDEFWIPYIQLREFYKLILGDNYLALPDFWIWNVDPKKNQAGWKPHRDKNRNALLANGMPKTLTTWIPLSPATPLNGCMYIVPADRDPTYNTDQESIRSFEYPDIRALPAIPGDFFMWNQAVFHWGSHTAAHGGESRVSMAFEFQRSDVPPFNQPLLDPNKILSFNDRLKLIAKQMLQYKHMYFLDEHMEKFANDALRS